MFFFTFMHTFRRYSLTLPLQTDINMETIQSIVAPLDSLLGQQKKKEGTVWRLMTFTVALDVDDGLLLHNTLTKSTVLLSADEAARLRSDAAALPELVEQWFVVPEEHDDRLLSRQVRAVGQAMKDPCNAITGYTIFTTTDCNARCFYCYERGHSRIPMTEGTALRVAAFVAKHCGDKEVELAWFGGEPLYNKAVIGIICRRLRELGVKYHSTMTTNGYLMDAATIKEARQDWLLRSVQITLDGTEEVYNRAKAYIYPGVNAYRKVIDNIHLMLKAGINVKIRLNADLYNADNLMQLADELDREFPDKRRLCVYSNPLFGSCMKRAAINSEQSRKELFMKLRELHDKLYAARLAMRHDIEHSLKLNRCMADRDASVTVLPTGHLGKCEHYTDSNFFGHIDSEERDEAMFSSFKKEFDELPLCAECPDYPNCFRLDKCEAAHECFPEVVDELRYRIEEGMLRLYKRYKRKKESECHEA